MCYRRGKGLTFHPVQLLDWERTNSQKKGNHKAENFLLKKYTDHLTIFALSMARDDPHHWHVTDGQMVPSYQVTGAELGDPVTPLPHSSVHKELLGSANPPAASTTTPWFQCGFWITLKRSPKSCLLNLYQKFKNPLVCPILEDLKLQVWLSCQFHPQSSHQSAMFWPWLSTLYSSTMLVGQPRATPFLLPFGWCLSLDAVKRLCLIRKHNQEYHPKLERKHGLG